MGLLDAVQGHGGSGTISLHDLPSPQKDTVHHQRLSQVFALAGWAGGFRIMRGYVHRESGGDPKAHNPSGATGLLQVMTPLHCGKYGLPKDTQACITALENPVTNLKVAHKLYASGGGNPWAYAAPGVRAPAATAPAGWDPLISWSDQHTLADDANRLGGAIAAPVNAITSPLNSVGDFLGKLSSADTWGRIAKGAGGGVAIVLGGAAIIFVVATKAGQSPIGKTVRKVTP